jgi:phage anti-repressor protein
MELPLVENYIQQNSAAGYSTSSNYRFTQQIKNRQNWYTESNDSELIWREKLDRHVRLNNKKPILVIKQSDLATFKKKRVNQLGLVSCDDLHELQAFTTNFYSKYRHNSRLKKFECSFCHSYEFLCVMVELYYTGRVKTRRNITRYFYSYLKFTPLFWLWVKFTPLFRLWVKFIFRFILLL